MDKYEKEMEEDLDKMSDLLLDRSEKIKELKLKIKQLEKALELACDNYLKIFCSDYCGNIIADDCIGCEHKTKTSKEYFLDQAQKQLEEENK